MTDAKRAFGRAALLAALALTLQSSTCHFHSCTGDGCDDDEREDDDAPVEILLLPPLRGPLGLPLSYPILLPARTRCAGSQG